MSSRKLAKASNKLIQGGSNKKMLFRHILKDFTGHTIKPLPVFKRSMIKELRKICEKTILEANKDMNFNDSSTKIGSLFEKYFDKAVNKKRRWSSESPKTLLGKNMASGYPDLVVTRKRRWIPANMAMYVEIKTMSETAKTSSAPSFSWQNSINAKITRTLPHILVGFSKTDKEFTGYELINLEDLYVDIEVKAITSNKYIYNPSNIIDWEPTGSPEVIKPAVNTPTTKPVITPLVGKEPVINPVVDKPIVIPKMFNKKED